MGPTGRHGRLPEDDDEEDPKKIHPRRKRKPGDEDSDPDKPIKQRKRRPRVTKPE